MSELQQYIELMLKSDIQKIIISNPISKSEEYKKIAIERKPIRLQNILKNKYSMKMLH